MFFLRFERRHVYKENDGDIDSVRMSMSVDLCSREEFEAEVSGAGRKRRFMVKPKQDQHGQSFHCIGSCRNHQQDHTFPLPPDLALIHGAVCTELRQLADVLLVARESLRARRQ